MLFGKLESVGMLGGQDYMSSKLVIDSLYVSVQKSKRAVVVYMNLVYIMIVP